MNDSLAKLKKTQKDSSSEATIRFLHKASDFIRISNMPCKTRQEHTKGKKEANKTSSVIKAPAVSLSSVIVEETQIDGENH